MQLESQMKALVTAVPRDIARQESMMVVVRVGKSAIYKGIVWDIE